MLFLLRAKGIDIPSDTAYRMKAKKGALAAYLFVRHPFFTRQN